MEGGAGDVFLADLRLAGLSLTQLPDAKISSSYFFILLCCSSLGKGCSMSAQQLSPAKRCTQNGYMMLHAFILCIGLITA